MTNHLSIICLYYIHFHKKSNLYFSFQNIKIFLSGNIKRASVPFLFSLERPELIEYKVDRHADDRVDQRGNVFGDVEHIDPQI